MSDPKTISADSIRDAAALITAVVHIDRAGQQAIIDNCDHSETLRTLAGMFAMLMQVSSGCSDAILADVVHEFAENLARDIAATEPGRG